MKKIIFLVAAGVLLGFGGIALAHNMKMPMAGGAARPQRAAAAAPNAVTIDDFAFGPTTLTVAAGTTVTWTNRDEEPHTVMSASNPPLFKSDALDTGDRFAFTFAKPGTYKYFCAIHPQMVGTVVVQ